MSAVNVIKDKYFQSTKTNVVSSFRLSLRELKPRSYWIHNHLLHVYVSYQRLTLNHSVIFCFTWYCKQWSRLKKKKLFLINKNHLLIIVNTVFQMYNNVERNFTLFNTCTNSNDRFTCLVFVVKFTKDIWRKIQPTGGATAHPALPVCAPVPAVRIFFKNHRCIRSKNRFTHVYESRTLYTVWILEKSAKYVTIYK